MRCDPLVSLDQRLGSNTFPTRGCTALFAFIRSSLDRLNSFASDMRPTSIRQHGSATVAFGQEP